MTNEKKQQLKSVMNRMVDRKRRLFLGIEEVTGHHAMSEVDDLYSELLEILEIVLDEEESHPGDNP